MPRFFMAGTNIKGGMAIIRGRDAEHVRVLRLRPGEDLIICDGEGTDYKCRLVYADKEQAEAEVLEVVRCPAEPSVAVTVLCGLPKGDRTDYIIQKCVEAGASEIAFFNCDRCVARPELLLRRLGPRDAAVGQEEDDLARAGLDAFLDDIVGPVALGQAAEHRHGDGGLGGTGDDLDHLGLDLVRLGADETALVIRPLRVADDQILAGAQTQHAHMLGVAAADDRHAALEIRTGHKKSRHRAKPPFPECFNYPIMP